jgi:hypothetical protein
LITKGSKKKERSPDSAGLSPDRTRSRNVVKRNREFAELAWKILRIILEQKDSVRIYSIVCGGIKGRSLCKGRIADAKR